MGSKVKSSVRQNWAATVLYYSLVHAGRLTVFMGAGDFPTRHSDLPLCFDQRSNGRVRVNWLSGFLQEDLLGRRPPGRATTTCCEDLLEQWRAILGDSVSPDAIKEHFAWLQGTLDTAKTLRNENNYEALLIAHEYRHVVLTDAFQDLAESMYKAAFHSAEVIGRWISYGLGRGLTFLDRLTAPKQQSFFANQIRERVRTPVKLWYPKRVQETISGLVSMFEDLPNYSDDAEIVRSIQWQIFNPKRSLMTAFNGKVPEFAFQVDPTNNRYALEARCREESRRQREAALEV